jgi:diketogulonate reductase-like aldo/keto reductase
MTKFRAGFSRRQFLRCSAATSLLSAFAPTYLAAAEAAVIRKTIPSSGERLAVMGLGTSRTFDVDVSSATKSPLLEVVQAFFDNGGQLIDSSPMYGNAEAVTGALLAQIGNKELFSATKVWTRGKREGIEQMERSRQRFGVERIDLIQIHNLSDWQVQLETLIEWKAQGKIRYIGITTSHGRDHAELETILQQQALDFVQFSYNILDRSVEKRLLPIAQERGIATLINRPYQRGSLFGRVKGKPLPEWAGEIDCVSWGQFFLKFIASHPGVTCIIPATSKLKHMLDNMAAGYGRLPDESMRRRMIETIEAL